MSMVYGLLKCRIRYAEDDKYLKEGEKKMDEIWINYCGMPVCFGLKEFAIVTNLRCDHPEESLIKETPPPKISKANRIAKPSPSNRRKALSKKPLTKTNKQKKKIDGLLDITGRSYKTVDLIEDLKDKTITKQYREKLCLILFAHTVILARDINKVIEDDLLKLAVDFEKFNNYPWGYNNY
ncbi:putative glycerol-3-phosphate 2-O-acyltransferase 6-like [Capsicum annuum]|nr:putative glycerol-3-phosphate 2-O-acyltransferase 6-like [Capsicum annuum]